MYKNIIFDLGNVLLDFSPKVHMEKDFQLDSVETLHKIIFLSEEWLGLDRGTLTEHEAIQIFSERHPEYKEEIIQVFEKWYDMLEPIRGNVGLLEKLKDKGYKLYYLSNFHDAAFAEVTKRNTFFELFDGGVVSFQVKRLKPEREIYEELLTRYELRAEECIFIDDTKKNIEGAMQLGIEGIWLEDRLLLEKEFVDRGIL